MQRRAPLVPAGRGLRTGRVRGGVFEDEAWSVTARSVGNRIHSPLVPLHVLLVGESSEVGGERTTGERDRELASLVDGVALRLDDEVGEGVCLSARRH